MAARRNCVAFCGEMNYLKKCFIHHYNKKNMKQYTIYIYDKTNGKKYLETCNNLGVFKDEK